MLDRNRGDVYNYLYNAILTQELKPGQPISEIGISKALGISRSPLREALRILQAEGLVNHYPGRGMFVAAFTEKDLMEVYALRELFEVYSLENMIRYVSDEQLDKLEENFRNAKQDSGFDREKMFQADLALHSAIIKGSGNYRLQEFMNTLDIQSNVIKNISRGIPELFQISCEKHIAIIQAIRERNLELAQERLRNHIQEAKHRTIEAIRTSEITGIKPD